MPSPADPRVLSLDRARFDHVGIPTDRVHDGATWLEADGVWVTDPRAHPLNVEWVHHTPLSRMPERLKRTFHLAYRVDDIDAALRSGSVVVPPFDIADGFVRVAFADYDGVLVELMQYRDPDEERWIP